MKKVTLPWVGLALFIVSQTACTKGVGESITSNNFSSSGVPGPAPDPDPVPTPAPLPSQTPLPPATGQIYQANPGNYKAMIEMLKAGDTLELSTGSYPLLFLFDLAGEEANWIYIKGPPDKSALIYYPAGMGGYDTVDIRRSHHLAVMNLTIDGRNLGYNGISLNVGPCHHIWLQDNVIKNVSDHQQTVGISTTSAGTVWDVTIRRNIILDAGTGLYLGDSTGGSPFIGGLIEHNLIHPTKGYNMQIKYQNNRTPVAGMPTEPRKTLVRHNVFLKDDRIGEDGARPNLLVGGFPDSGVGATDFYEIYGNFFYGNQTESLLQATGRFAIYNNIFATTSESGVTVTNHDGKAVKVAYVFNNTFFNTGGVNFASAAQQESLVVGNIFSGQGASGTIQVNQSNLTHALSEASLYFVKPSNTLGAMDFVPLNATSHFNSYSSYAQFLGLTDANLDFNQQARQTHFVGAYSGSGTNPGWALSAELKP
jgi:hypothetical protein